MTCRKVRKLIPHAAGNDLRTRQAAAFRAHLDKCPVCREELEGFRRALAGIKAAAKAESVAEWSEGEWSALMARVNVAAKEEALAGESRALQAAPRWSWAAASAFGAFLGLIVLGVLFKGPSLRTRGLQDGGGTAIASNAARQDKVAITMVSPETGLQVVWFLDKNFDYKGEQE